MLLDDSILGRLKQPSLVATLLDKQASLLLRNLHWDKSGLHSRRDPTIPAVDRPEAREALKAQLQGNPLQALVEAIAQTQALKSRWQGHLLQALVEAIAQTQALKPRWQGHLLQALVEIIAKT